MAEDHERDRDGHGSEGPESGGDESRGLDAEARAAHARSVYALAGAMLRWGMRLAVPSSLVTVGVATLVAGGPGLAGAGFGVVLGFGSALVTLAMMRSAARRPASALLGFALGGYAAKMAALLVVMLLLRDVQTFSRPALAFGMLVTVVAWAAAEVVAFQRTKTPTIVITSTSAHSSGHGPN